MSSLRRPFTALLLSVILPGGGHIYNKEAKKGIVIFGCCVGLGVLVYALAGFNKLSVALALLLLWMSAIVDAYKTAKASGRTVDFYYRRPYVVTMLLCVGPLALPLLWQSPHFSATARWLWTGVVVGALLLFIATPYVGDWLLRRY